MTIQQLQAEIERLKAENKALTDSKISFKLSDAGYIEIKGIPGNGWKGLSATVQGWKKVFEIQKEALAFVQANEQEATRRFENWKSKKH